MAVADEIDELVNKTYLDKAGTKAGYALGDKLVIERPYFDECWVLSKKMIDDIASAAKRRLSKPAPTDHKTRWFFPHKVNLRLVLA